MFKIGSHVGMKSPYMLVGSANEAYSYNANSMMIFTGAPQNTRRKNISELNIQEGKKLIDKYGINDVVGHAPYIVNLGNTIKPANFNFGIDFMREEVKRCDAIGIQSLSFHPGSHVGAGPELALKQIAKGLNEIITNDQKVSIAIETMAGKGTEVGITFDQLATILDKITLNDKVSITFDTCHTNDAGYNVKDDFDGVLNEFDHIIGIDKIKVLHLNDSKNIQGSHKDRHENIGFGTIGFETLNYIAHHPQLEDIPKIMETPYVKKDDDDKKGKSPYKEEISMLRNEKFDPDMIKKIQKK